MNTNSCQIGLMLFGITGWLEPLLSRIADDKRHVVTPVIETIEAKNFTMKVSKYQEIQVGKFSWELQFNWMSVPDYIKKNLTSKAMPIRFVIVKRDILQHGFAEWDKIN